MSLQNSRGDTVGSLDALHVASALAVRPALAAFIAYDTRVQLGQVRPGHRPLPQARRPRGSNIVNCLDRRRRSETHFTWECIVMLTTSVETMV